MAPSALELFTVDRMFSHENFENDKVAAIADACSSAAEATASKMNLIILVTEHKPVGVASRRIIAAMVEMLARMAGMIRGEAPG